MITRTWTAAWILTQEGPPIPDGRLVAAADGRILIVGPRTADDPPPLPGSVLTPGLVNAHTHLELTVPAPIPRAPGQSMVDWLRAVVAQQRAPGFAEARLERARAGVAQLLATGTTTVNDIASDGASAQALGEAGLRGWVSLEVFHPRPDPVSLEPLLPRWQAFCSAVARWPRLQAGLSPHSPYSVSPRAWQALLDAFEPALVHTHLAESRDELNWLAGDDDGPLAQMLARIAQAPVRPLQTGLSPVAYLDAFGLLSPRMVAAHGVYTTPADRARLGAAGVRLAHCPRSNHWLQGETLDAADWDGLPLALGTDSTLSNTDLDLRAEARVAMAAHGWTPAVALARLTRLGGEVLGLPVGRLAPKWAADLALWQAPEAVRVAQPDAASWVLAPETQLVGLWVAGQPVGQTRQEKGL